MPYPVSVGDQYSVLSLDIPLFYPNPLANNDTYAPYAPSKMYQAGEFFKFVYEANDLENAPPSIPTSFTWNRLSQWLPWMKMGDALGQLVFTGQGSKINGFKEIPPVILYTIGQRSPLYLHAPKCMLDTPDMTSWLYFAKYFDLYLRGEVFPIYEETEHHPCRNKSSH